MWISVCIYVSIPWKFGQRKSNGRPLRIVSLNTGVNFVIKISEILSHWAGSDPGLIKSIAAVAAVDAVSVCLTDPLSTGPHVCFSSPVFCSWLIRAGRTQCVIAFFFISVLSCFLGPDVIYCTACACSEAQQKRESGSALSIGSIIPLLCEFGLQRVRQRCLENYFHSVMLISEL